MTVSYDFSHRAPAPSAVCLEDRFEVIKEIGDGSFGSVDLARVRTAGSHIARRGTLVAIKTMKKTFDSFAPCLELREVIFLRTLPLHPHLVPALDIFLDPLTRKLHICMEYMDGNLYQLMKSRDHKCLDGSSVKSILFQILGGLQHIHAHEFFHRDIKPENILVSTSSPQDVSTAFRRYSSLVTPPSTPPTYSVKIADFGLARETRSPLPYTTYVSTRWYRAPEVLLRAGEYSAPVDIWAIGAMAVEIATLKPLFPGGNEVDQVWRVCEVMGSPGNWYNKNGSRVGGGEWRDGVRLAQKLGFSFPKMAPHSIDTILQAPQWPSSLSQFVTWCLMWDPKSRPTSTQALNHEFFTDAVDPLRPKSALPRLTKKPEPVQNKRESTEGVPQLTTKSSWFRKSLITKDGVPPPAPQVPQTRPTPEQSQSTAASSSRPIAEKRATWTNGISNAAPMPILPTIRPISPLSDAVTAQSHQTTQHGENRGPGMDEKVAKKIGRQLSVASNGNHYADIHRQEAERALNGNGVASPMSQKEGFFSHLRKRARRLSGRHQIPLSPPDDIEANAGCGPWSNRSSMAIDSATMSMAANADEFKDLDRALQNVRYSVENTTPLNVGNTAAARLNFSQPKRHSLPQGHQTRSVGDLTVMSNPTAPISSRTRRALQMSTHPVHRYETPDEEEELLDEMLASAQRANTHLNQNGSLHPDRSPLRQSASNIGLSNPYPTPSPSAKRNSVVFGNAPRPVNIQSQKASDEPKWPTPPYDENEWAAAAAASIYAAGAAYQ